MTFRSARWTTGAVWVAVEAQQPAAGFTLVLANGRRIESRWRFADGDPLQLKGFAVGIERAVVLFQRTVLNEKLEPVNFFSAVEVHDRKIQVRGRERNAGCGRRLCGLHTQS